MIKLNNVNKYFNKNKKNEIHVINNTSLEFPSTGLVALLGPSGCGKTTLLNTIGGLDKINKGQIFINNQRITKRSANKIDKIRNLSIGYIFQDYHLLNDKTVYENVALVLKMIGIKDKEEIKLRVNYVLETVGIYRYRNRLAGMLSGGERQRVGIARAIVKNPDIILADEPTGNLDSKNTIEIMNIIKSISKDKLVLLVTHEKDLAYFYSSRIIEIKDGKIESDYNNDHQDDLDYQMDNKIYLKDLAYNDKLNKDKIKVDYYGNNPEPIKLEVVVINNNIYIKTDSLEKVEVIDNNSNIELIDDHYQKITKKDYEKYNFDLTKLDNNKFKIKYTSIFNPITLIINGFKKVFDYSIIKKLLLLGFFLSGMFILFALSNIFGITNIDDSKFVKVNKDYLAVEQNNFNVKDYLEYESLKGIDYIIPGNSLVSFTVRHNKYLQTINAQESFSGSMTDINSLKNEDLIYGRMPNNEKEIVIDALVFKTSFNYYTYKHVGLTNEEDYLNYKFNIPIIGDYILVGVSNTNSPNIYVHKSQMINILQNHQSFGYFDMMTSKPYEPERPIMPEAGIYDYQLFNDDITLKRGKYPENPYEVIVNYNDRFIYPLNKKIETKINNTKLIVVGYYETKSNINHKLVNEETIKYSLISTANQITIMPKEKDQALSELRNKNLSVQETYLSAKKDYSRIRSSMVASAITVSIVILAISFIEIFLIIRSSFLSRIKEVGTLRAIGMKKGDIYKMFLGEIIAITSTASLLGIAFMSFILDRLTRVQFFKDQFMISPEIILLSIILLYAFNLLVGLIPVYNTIKKTPSAILSRTDVD